MITEPMSDKEWEDYNLCRWVTLRKPWNQPRGSEIIADDDNSFHAMFTIDNKVCGVIRMHLVEGNLYQIRSMGVYEEYRKQGVGKKLVHYMENLAKAKGGSEILLHARDYAIPFYENCGYKVQEKSYLLFDEIQHFKMTKKLTNL